MDILTPDTVLEIKMEPSEELWGQEVDAESLQTPVHYLAQALLGEELSKAPRSDQTFLFCIGCCAGFSTAALKVAHEKKCKVNVDGKKLMCIYCNQATATPSELRAHEERHCPPGSDAGCVCLVCFNSFPTIYELQKHKHSAHGPYKRKVFN